MDRMLHQMFVHADKCRKKYDEHQILTIVYDLIFFYILHQLEKVI